MFEEKIIKKMSKMNESFKKALNTIGMAYGVELPELSGLSEKEIDVKLNDFTDAVISKIENIKNICYGMGYTDAEDKQNDR